MTTTTAGEYKSLLAEQQRLASQHAYLVDPFRKLSLAKTAEDFEALLRWHFANQAA